MGATNTGIITAALVEANSHYGVESYVSGGIKLFSPGVFEQSEDLSSKLPCSFYTS